ncbi:MAG: hypothetical protein HEQ22_03980 [Sphingopyxis sp.]|uniref:hypothetical protein n=1 Tax=Sphingopyxis sp. TaxID=1908224 RepID=UPI003D80DBA5
MATKHHQSFFKATKILFLVFISATFTGSLLIIGAAWLLFMIALMPIYHYRCGVCGAHPYRINSDFRRLLPKRGDWDFWLNGPNMRCPHDQAHRSDVAP